MPLPKANKQSGKRLPPVVAQDLIQVPTASTGPKIEDGTPQEGKEPRTSSEVKVQPKTTTETIPTTLVPDGSVADTQESCSNGNANSAVHIAAGACGQVSIIQHMDPATGKSEIRVMKEMENKNEDKCLREKAQFNRRSCHPNMIKYLYYGPSSNPKRKHTHTQVQMELMDLGSLKRVVDNTILTPADRHTLCETVGYQMFMALDYFHFFFGGMHRDVKPANILLNTQGRVKLCDFDTSVADSLDHDTLLGTASYAAPEVIQNKSHDFRCDIWGLGTVLFEVATGVHPYMKPGETLCDMFTKIPCLSESIDWSLLHHMPPSFTDLMKMCLVDNTTSRCTASEALMHDFFADISKGRRRDQKAEVHCQKYGIAVDPQATMKMHTTWRSFLANAEGTSLKQSSSSQSSFTVEGAPSDSSSQPSFSSSSPLTPEKTTTDEKGTNMSTTATTPMKTQAVPAVAAGSSTAASTLVPGSPEGKKKAKLLCDVMKSILYSWEHASVVKLEVWLRGHSKELHSIVEELPRGDTVNPKQER